MKPTISGGPSTPNLVEARFRIEDLLTPTAFPHAVTHVQLKETHISWIVLTGQFAYKIKKPVHFEFIDASTLERRRALCEEELRLNLRTAPDLYIDVVPLAYEHEQLLIAGAGTPIEYAVRMHQFEASQELASLLAEGSVTVHDITALATSLANFHRRATVAPATSPHGTFQKVREQILDVLALLLGHLPGEEWAAELGRLNDWTCQSLVRLQLLIERRKHAGAVRECHGDLHARNIVRWRQQWLPFDCIEFDPTLRWIDVMSDTAFLFMDIAAHRRQDLAFACLSRYLEENGDYQGLRVLPLYAVYRALVRAMIDTLSAETSRTEEAQALRARLTDRIKVAAHLMGQHQPALVLMHGPTACGKSWLSDRLVAAVHAVRVRSDLERKRLQGVAPLERRTSGVNEGNYAETATDATYARLYECAQSALEAGFTIIVDAAFLNARHREMFHALALQQHCVFLIVSCRADRATLEARIDTRAKLGLDPSEATLAVLEDQLARQEPLTTPEQAHVIVVDTNWLASADAGIEAVRDRLAQDRLH